MGATSAPRSNLSINTHCVKVVAYMQIVQPGVSIVLPQCPINPKLRAVAREKNITQNLYPAVTQIAAWDLRDSHHLWTVR